MTYTPSPSPDPTPVTSPTSEVIFPDPSQSPWTHPDTGLVYEYNATTGVWLPVSGGGGEFPDIDKPDQQPGTIDDRYVNITGDTMSGGLVSPALTTGPDDDDKSILYMDDGQDAYNVGPHELEAKSGNNGGLYFDGSLLAKDADLTALSVELNGVGDNVRETLDELDDVSVAGATDTQILAYDAGSGNWVARDEVSVPPSIDFQREIDCSTEEAPDSPAIGELYIQHRTDEADGVTPLASWTGITAATVDEGDFIVFGSDGEWHIAGNNLNSSVQPDWSVVDSTDPAFIKNKPTEVSAFNNDANYLTQGNGTTAIVSDTPPLTKENGDALDVGQLWLSSENLELHVWANGWKQIDTNDGGGSGGGGGGTEIHTDKIVINGWDLEVKEEIKPGFELITISDKGSKGAQATNVYKDGQMYMVDSAYSNIKISDDFSIEIDKSVSSNWGIYQQDPEKANSGAGQYTYYANITNTFTVRQYADGTIRGYTKGSSGWQKTSDMVTFESWPVGGSLDSGGSFKGMLISPTNPDVVVVSHGNMNTSGYMSDYVKYTHDGGATWKNAWQQTGGRGNGKIVNRYAINPINQQILISGNYKTWLTPPLVTSRGENLGSETVQVAHVPSGETYEAWCFNGVYFILNKGGTLYRSEDPTNGWETIATYSKLFQMDYNPDKDVIVAVNGADVYYSTDLGQSFVFYETLPEAKRNISYSTSGQWLLAPQGSGTEASVAINTDPLPHLYLNDRKLAFEDHVHNDPHAGNP